ncbi:ABC transporter substrate-binding protein [Paenibacillus mesophilus]|uniref:ABC transporter substrate-binding protein n=1 Tax=Paenibacillus mesophilus TaxID=2582849 RepID=UPI001305114E|nr:extracellular solute-binding protein [Paenibacillus mesophilus]
MKKRIVSALAIVLPLLLVAGCGGSRQPAAENAPAAENPPKPVTLKVFVVPNVGEEYYNNLIAAHIKKKFPHITLEWIPYGQKLPELLASGNAPDLIFDGLTNLIPTLELDIPLSLDELAERNKFDFSKIQPEMIKEIRSYSKTGELVAWPQAKHIFALHYNKDIFDQFGVPYPKEGSTWEEVMELAAKLSRTHEGIEYRGLSPGVGHNRLSTQLSAPYVDPKTEKSVIGTHESWRKLFQTYKDVFGIPGNYPKGAAYNDAARAFMTDKKLAMYPHLLMLPDPKLGVNMGLTTFPFFKDKPWIGPSGFMEVMVISKTTKNPDAAFQVVAYLTSDEVQTSNARLGMNPVVTNTQAQMSLFADLPAAKGIDFTPFFKMKPAESYSKTIYDAAGSKAAIKYLQEFINGKLDLNTALSRADEETNKAIEEQNKK